MRDHQQTGSKVPNLVLYIRKDTATQRRYPTLQHVLVADQGRGPEIGFARESGHPFVLDAWITLTQESTHTAFVKPDGQNNRSNDEAADFVAYAAGTVVRADLTTWHCQLGAH